MGKYDDIAVIGLSCRLPGAGTPDALWRLLREGGDAVGPAPEGRATGRGGFLDRVDLFDARFFGISPREADAVDPQQRLVLELGWEALEDAGVVPATLRRGQVGVFVGAMWDDYAALCDVPDRHAMTGQRRTMIANRLSHFLGLRGPSLTVDTAQSSSLVAVHLACESLRGGESRLALAGGVNLVLAEDGWTVSSAFGALSPDGRCFTFDHRANGYVRGEGGGLVLLKPLADALADGDTVHCVIRGSAVNNDGPCDGLTVPDAEAQQQVVRSAYERAGVRPSKCSTWSCTAPARRWGTRSRPRRWVGSSGRRGSRWRFGSIKTNIGHLEAAAGVAGLLKAVLAIGHREIPPSLNFERSAIPLAELNLKVQTELGPWPDGPLVAGVSSFGMGGTNCHVVLGEAPPRAEAARASGVMPWVLSGRTPAALCAQAAQLKSCVDLPVLDVGFSLATSRTHFEHRAAVLDDHIDGLTALAESRSTSDLVVGEVTEGGLAFLFTGQGAQRLGMGRGLYEAFPVFARAYDEVLGCLDIPDLGVEATGFAQPALFALEVALFRLVESWGVRPDFVLGHSIGELAAAHVAGVWSLPDAAKVVAARAWLMQALPPGAMVAVRASEDEIKGVDVAAVNGPWSVVLSGDEDAVLRVAERFEHQRLAVSHAFHSRHVEPMLDEFRAVLESVGYEAPSVPLVSGEVCLPEYWVRQARDTVRFADGVTELARRGVTRFLELGPDAVLSALGAENVEGEFVPVLRKGHDERRSALRALARLHVSGVAVDWTAFADGAHRVALPTYAFQRQRHWFGENRRPVVARARDHAAIVAAQVAAVLGYESGDTVDLRRTFTDLGCDSISVVELRNSLNAALGTRLPTTILYERPTPAALIRFLDGEQGTDPVPAATDPDEPIAIVAMGCRYPGGVRVAGGPVAAGGRRRRRGRRRSPTDRGWD